MCHKYLAKELKKKDSSKPKKIDYNLLDLAAKYEDQEKQYCHHLKRPHDAEIGEEEIKAAGNMILQPYRGVKVKVNERIGMNYVREDDKNRKAKDANAKQYPFSRHSPIIRKFTILAQPLTSRHH